MKIARLWMIGIPIALIVAIIGIWFAWPSITYRLALSTLNGSAAGSDWSFSMNTFTHRISSADVANYYSSGSERLLTLDSESRTYSYEDSMGYTGCVIVSQQPESYEFIQVFGANDNDSISVGRASGTFLQGRFQNPTEILDHQLPAGIIRPW